MILGQRSDPHIIPYDTEEWRQTVWLRRLLINSYGRKGAFERVKALTGFSDGTIGKHFSNLCIGYPEKFREACIEALMSEGKYSSREELFRHAEEAELARLNPGKSQNPVNGQGENSALEETIKKILKTGFSSEYINVATSGGRSGKKGDLLRYQMLLYAAECRFVIPEKAIEHGVSLGYGGAETETALKRLATLGLLEFDKKGGIFFIPDGYFEKQNI